MATIPNLGVSQLVRTTTSTLGAVVQSADIFTTYVDKVRKKQEIEHQHDLNTFEELSRNKYVKLVLESRNEIKKLAKNKDDAKEINSIIQMLKKPVR